MIKIINQRLKPKELRGFLDKPFPDMIKFVVDVQKEIMTLGGELHSDAQAVLLEAGSKPQNLWGGNIYPDHQNQIQYTSMINIRPSVGNRSLEVKDAKIRNQIKVVLDKLIL